jgi:hypothetical protein
MIYQSIFIEHFSMITLSANKLIKYRFSSKGLKIIAIGIFHVKLYLIETTFMPKILEELE